MSVLFFIEKYPKADFRSSAASGSEQTKAARVFNSGAWALWAIRKFKTNLPLASHTNISKLNPKQHNSLRSNRCCSVTVSLRNLCVLQPKWQNNKIIFKIFYYIFLSSMTGYFVTTSPLPSPVRRGRKSSRLGVDFRVRCRHNKNNLP